ncbi:MAG TPA: hypothetical protein VIF08_08385 [Candidatus Limnocylindrales bacterium]
MLDPDLRSEAFDNDEERYKDLARQAEWSRFLWSIDGVGADGSAWQYAYLALPGGPDSIPSFLANANGLSIVNVLKPTADARRARVAIRRDASGEWWVYAYDVVMIPSFEPVPTDLSP